MLVSAEVTIMDIHGVYLDMDIHECLALFLSAATGLDSVPGKLLSFEVGHSIKYSLLLPAQTNLDKTLGPDQGSFRFDPRKQAGFQALKVMQ